ncbi:MAG TPA: cobalt ECF transporter T component CbiQ [Firmicutes bacterium]|nr:cobalt ECF transporter T component CbiQ [Bacillota bacterium]
MFMLDWYAHHSKLRFAHPAEKASFVLLCLGRMASGDLEAISLAIVLLQSIIILFYLRIKPRFYVKLLLMPLAFLIPGCLAVALETIPAQAGAMLIMPLGSLTLGVSHDSLSLAVNILLRSLACVSALYFLTLTTTFTQLGWLLRKAKIPAGAAELALLTYRFIFVLADTAHSIYTSQSTRLGYSSWRNTLRSLGSLAAGLLIKSLDRSRLMYAALLSRCHEGAFPSLEMHYRFSLRNWLLIGGVAAALLALSRIPPFF